MTGVRINFDKSDLLTIGIEEERVEELEIKFCCKKGDFPIKYLGVPLPFSNLRREDI